MFQVLQSFFYCTLLAWKASKFYTIIQLISQTVSVIIPVAVTWNIKRILDLFSAVGLQDIKARHLFFYIFLHFMLRMFSLIATKIEIYASSMQQDVLLHYVEKEMAEMASTMDIDYFDNPKYYDAFETVKKDIYTILGAVYDCISIISFGISIGCCLTVLSSISMTYTLIILVAVLPVTISEYNYTKKIYLWGLDHVREERQMQYLYRTVTERTYAQEIRLYRIGNYLLKKYHNLWKIYFLEKRNTLRMRAIWNFTLSIFPEIFSAAALLNIGNLILKGKCTIGDFSLYNGLLIQIVSALNGTVASVMGLYEKKLKINHFSEFKSLVQTNCPSGKRILTEPVNIQFCNVSFRYPGTKDYILKNISFSLKQGKKLCIVGENGAGKTTIVKLLLRFYLPNKGEILINDIPIKEYDIQSLRNGFSCFFQKSSNFAFSLQENVTISNLNASKDTSEERFQYALFASGAMHILESLPYGKNTFLSRAYDEKGIELSGGENQKIALARMFYREAPVCILDEPSADLDPKSEHDLFLILKEKCNTKSLLLISHRLSNVFLADEILVLANGAVCACGSHEELLKNCSVYRKLYHYQADKYVETYENENSSN